MTRSSRIPEGELSLPLDIETERWAKLSSGVIRAGCLVFVALVTLAAFAPVREVTQAPGRLTTDLPPVLVEHLDGGPVARILVAQGDLVAAGQTLIELSGAAALSELAQIRARRAFLTLQRERLIAHVEGRDPDFAAQRAQFPDLVRDQRALFAAETAAVRAEVDATAIAIRERRMEHEAARKEADSLNAQVRFAESQLSIQNALLERGFTTRRQVLEAAGAVERNRADQSAAHRNGLAALRAIGEAERQDLTRRSERLRAWSAEISEISAEIAGTQETENRLRDRLARLKVTAPTDGIVQNVAVNGVGEVVAPGDPVATIVPGDQPLVAEIRVDPKDIGHIAVGATAELTVTTFEKEYFGAIAGVVRSISPSSFEDDGEDPYYIAIVELEGARINGPVRSGDLLPGMIVQGEFRTGEKSVLRYLLKPVVRALDTAFSER